MKAEFAERRAETRRPPVRLLSTLRAAYNRREALAFDELVAEQAARLIASPGLGRPGREPGTRELVTHRNYILIHEVQEMTVRMLRILHAARQWPTTTD